MHLVVAAFPVWLRATHWINVFFIGYMIRAGIQILGSYPRLYWNDNCTPGTEWLIFTKRKIPADKKWTSLDQELDVPQVLGHPGGNNLGLGRIWHFFAAIFWIANGIVYVVLLCTSGEWIHVVPTRWDIFPRAWETFVSFITFHAAPTPVFMGGEYDPLQKLSYFAVIFLLAPFLIVTAAAQSPAIEARWPWYPKLFGGRQAARSLHFLGLLAFLGFIFVHTLFVFLVHGPGAPTLPAVAYNFGDIIFGQHATNHGAAIAIVLALIAAIFTIYALTAHWSLRKPRQVQRLLGYVIQPLMLGLLGHFKTRQELKPEDISPYHIINGPQPDDPEYVKMLWQDFEDWRLEITGLVERPMALSLADLLTMPKREHIIRHNCIQGWTGIAQWGGVSMSEIIAHCQPRENVKFVVFHSWAPDNAHRKYYEVLTLDQVNHPQTILAYEMNYHPLPLSHGAPLRLRCETVLGYKMVKWLSGIEFVEEYAHLREGRGGSREDNRYYEEPATI